ncbi:MAG TPA: hypothetical protein VKQ06_01695 [Gammaproteobacteria bacterium]|nr:hypothetical protein [Gammaproteobacteria bacterium]
MATPRVRRAIPALHSALVTLLVSFGCSVAAAQSLTGNDLIEALQRGGFVLVIRNGSSAAERPEPDDAAPANRQAERELDDHGQGQMSVLGYAISELDIPIGRTLTSPAFRSRQSANYFGLGVREAVATLADGADSSWLASRVAEPPPPGENTVIVTHGSVITSAFGRDARDIETAETLIFQPRDGGGDLVARLTLEDWAKLALN